jgi:hypothetical protein
MTKLQPRQSRFRLKAIYGLILALTLGGAFAVASQARTANSSGRHGELHATKECSQHHGQAGEFCTITGSNLRQIPAGSRVFYLESAGSTELDSDLVLYTGPGNVAFGHVTLSFASRSGPLVFDGGTGRFRDFRARVLVTFDETTNLWKWDGRYRFDRG